MSRPPRANAHPSREALSRIVGEPLLSRDETAARLGVSIWTLANWRRPNNASAPNLPWRYAKEGIVYPESAVRRFEIEAASVIHQRPAGLRQVEAGQGQ